MIALWAGLYLTMTSNGTVLFTTDSQKCIDLYVDWINNSFIQAIYRAKYALTYGVLCPSVDSAADRITLKAGSIQLVPIQGMVYTVVFFTFFAV